jgi:hypothetical protein
MLGITAAVGVVAADGDLALVIEQSVKDMQGFARRRRDHFGVEWGIAIGEVGVEFAPGVVPVMGVDTAGIAAVAAGAEELAVRGGRGPAAEYRRKRLALLLVDQTAERQGVGLVANVPVDHPGELTEAGDRASFRHARQAEIEPIGQEARHQNAWVDSRLTASQMGEAVGEQRPTRHLRQQVGDADARHHRVETGGQGLGFRRCRFVDRRDLQHTPLERDVRQQPAFRLQLDRRQPLLEESAAARSSKSASTAIGKVPLCCSSC